MLATNEPQKLLHAIRTRCTKIKVNPLSFDNLQKVITSVADKAGIEVPQRVINRIAEVSEGSAREALVLLQKVKGLKTEGDMLAAVLSSEVKQSAWDLTKALLYEGRKRPNWGRIAKILKDLEGEEVEGIRHLILVNARGVLYKGGPQANRAAAIMDMMIDTLFESKHPGLSLACYRICNPS
jgi:DNA polymerase III delta prime subunit